MKLSRVWELAREYWFDALVVGALAWWLADAAVHLHQRGSAQGPMWFDALAVLAATMPLLARRRYPVAVLVVCALGVALASFVDSGLVKGPFVSFLIGLTICFRFGMRPWRLQSVAGLAFVMGIAALVELNAPQGKVGDFIWHSVSVMTVQASAVRRLLEQDQERVSEALQVVEQTGREALAEMRRMVGVLRHAEDGPALAPQPSLEQIERLVEHTRNAGLPVDLRVEGDPVQLPTGVDLTAYRLVQEGLTNAIKHAGANRAEVLVRYAGGHVEVTVSDDGDGDGGGEGGGHGLVGMRERVSVYGGKLEAGSRPEGGFRLRATLPVV